MSMLGLNLNTSAALDPKKMICAMEHATGQVDDSERDEACTRAVLHVVTHNASSMINAFAFTGWETEEDDDDDNFDDCPERFTKALLSEFHQLEQFRFGCAANSLHLAVKDAIRQDPNAEEVV
ncbi:hypothetical protein HPB52_024060 [Rhipicephalus sanguineus]|uniref:Uncharacterized protein n=1 Tax=Rhipicephalus sanguineus TaxID=34632 RepID=A0A9D4Q8X4_RHISA|nr:hypothetical protein HPB52_024060 [Rhipicephalus sanguineus]